VIDNKPLISDLCVLIITREIKVYWII